MRGCARQELQILSTHFSSGKVWRKGSGDAFYWRGKGEALIFLHGASPAARSSPLICRAKQQRGPFSPSETCICLFVLCEGLKPPHPFLLGWGGPIIKPMGPPPRKGTGHNAPVWPKSACHRRCLLTLLWPGGQKERPALGTATGLGTKS